MPEILQLFKNLKLLPLKSQYIFPFYYMLPKIYIYMNRVQKFIILTLYLVLTYVLQLQTKSFQKGPFYFVIKVFNHLLISIKNTSHDINQFRSVLKSFLLINSFYSVEYFTWNYNRDLGSILFYIITFNLNS